MVWNFIKLHSDWPIQGLSPNLRRALLSQRLKNVTSKAHDLDNSSPPVTVFVSSFLFLLSYHSPVYTHKSGKCL